MRDVSGKIAFITGGSSGIGLGITRAFLAAGMKVAITFRTRANLDEAMRQVGRYGDRIHAIDADVTDREAMVAAAEETVRVFGKVHVLVNNAGVGALVPLSEATFDDWDWLMRVNVDGVFNGIRSFLPHIRGHADGGHIVSTASMSGLVVGGIAGVYSTSKFAVVGMMEALRNELKDTNIGVSVFCPGLVKSKIRDSKRNRPHESGEAKRSVERAPPAANPSPVAYVNPGMDALEAGERVLRGIRNNDLYILTHAEFEQGIRDRNEALLASIPAGEPPPPRARLAVEAPVLRASIYYQERDRKQREARQALAAHLALPHRPDGLQ